MWLEGPELQYWPTALTSQHWTGVEDCYELNPYSYDHVVAGAPSATKFEVWEDITRAEASKALRKVSYEEGITWSIAPHAATAQLHSNFWFDSRLRPRYSYLAEGLTSEMPVNVTAVRTVCADHIETFSNLTTEVSVPLLFEFEERTTDHVNDKLYKAVKVDKRFWAVSGSDLSDIKIVWTQPDLDMHAVTASFLVLGPSIGDSSDRLGVPCSIDARWNNEQKLVMSPFKGRYCP